MRLRSLCAALLLTSAFVPSRAEAQYPPVVSRSRLDPSKGVNFHAILLPDTVYVGQQATYQIGVFLNQEVRQRLRRNPEFLPPETRSLLVYDLPDAKAPLVGTIDGRAYEVHVFQRAFFALSPGRFDIPPAKLSYSLPQSASFFSREDTHSLRSEALSLVVLPVPTAGRPDDWRGAVGDWRARLRIDSTSGQVGNPLVVTMRVEGQGNVALVPRPPLVVEWGTVVAADERVTLDSTPSTLRGAKEFDWLVTPRTEGRQVIAGQKFSYFNPTTRRFEQALTGEAVVDISAGDAVATDSTAAPEPATAPVVTGKPLTLRPDDGSQSMPSWLRAPWFVLLMLLAPLPAIAGVIARRPRRARRSRSAAEQLAADGTRGATELRQLMQTAIRERLHFDPGLALADGSLITALRHEGVTVETARRAETLLRLLDAAAFGGDASVAPPSRDLAALYAAIDSEARGIATRTTRRRAPRAAVALLLMLGAARLAGQSEDIDRVRAEGRTAFVGGNYALAARLFGENAKLQPRNAAAWANAGTAAWQGADTARAVQGWQRALRLAPIDLDLRARLALARAVQDRGPARVPPIPANLIAALLLLCWLGGWGLLARRAWQRRPVALRAAGLVVVAAALLAAAAWVDDIDRGARYAVASRSEPLRALPVLGADRGPAPLTGEVARVLERRGAWAHVRFEGGREGWMAAEYLLPLGDD